MLTKSFVNERSSFGAFSEQNDFWSWNVFFNESFMIHLSYFHWFVTNESSNFFSQIFFLELFGQIMILSWNRERWISSNCWEIFNAFFFTNLFPLTTIHCTYSKNTFVVFCELYQLILNFRLRLSVIHFVIMNDTGSSISFPSHLGIEIEFSVINNIRSLHIIKSIVLFFTRFCFACCSKTE